MALSVVTRSGIKSGQNVGTFNFNITLPSNGNALIIEISCWNAGNVTFSAGNITDNKSNTWILAKTIFNNNGHGAAAIFYVEKVANSSGTYTITVASDKGSGNWFDCAVAEISGIGAKLNLGNTASNTGQSPANPTVGPVSVTHTEEFVAAAMEIASGEGSIAVEVTSPAWTQDFEQLSFANNSPGEGDSKIVSSTGNYSGNWTVGTPAQYAAVLAAFYASNAGIPSNKSQKGNKKGGGGATNTFMPGGTQVQTIGNAGISILS